MSGPDAQLCRNICSSNKLIILLSRFFQWFCKEDVLFSTGCFRNPRRRTLLLCQPLGNQAQGLPDPPWPPQTRPLPFPHQHTCYKTKNKTLTMRTFG